MGLGGIFDAWEQRKLGDVSNYIKGFAFKSKDYKKDGVRIIQVSDLTKDKIKCSNTNIFVSLELAELNKKYRINKNEIIITTVGSKAEIKESAVGRPIIVAEEGHFLLNQNLVKLTSLQGFDNYFIYSQLLQPRYINYIAAIERGNANQANIAIIDLWQYTFLVPKKLEQQKISMFFKQLDNTIALHQRKLDSLKLMKKGFLQLMFPKKGEKAPKLRFADSEERWEQRKLGEIFTERTERSDKGELISVTINSGIVKASELERKDNSSSNKSNYKVIKKGDIAYNSMRMWQGASGCSFYDGILSPAYTVISPKEDIDPNFMSYMFKKHEMIHLFQRNSQGLTSDTWNLKFPSLSTIKVKIPPYEEQVRIANLLQNTENIITFQQNKISQLQALKKAHLQNMFI
ncbi:restriction endonuclease subunit S [Listeria seeligeri]|uniref:restriction endonuclease subunit S n=1 Tax=Listeria seeligeri TaxID=1640 RepID=UPI0022EBB9B8|nr:restriction endonuclease subunit S [Listeria seeligeri]